MYACSAYNNKERNKYKFVTKHFISSFFPRFILSYNQSHEKLDTLILTYVYLSDKYSIS